MRIKAIQLTPLQEGGLIFFITGTILLIAALFACVQWSANFSSGATVTAEIEQIRRERSATIDDEYHYVAYVRYTYEGVTYDHIPLYNFSSSMREGDSVELLINPATPAAASACPIADLTDPTDTGLGGQSMPSRSSCVLSAR